MGVVAIGDHRVAQRDHIGKVDVVPIHRRRWRDTLHGSRQPGAEVDDDGVGMRGDEASDPVVEQLRAQRRLTDRAGRHPQTGEVVIDLADDLVGKGVTEYRPGPTAVDRAGVLGDERGPLDRRQVGDRKSHTGNLLRD